MGCLNLPTCTKCFGIIYSLDLHADCEHCGATSELAEFEEYVSLQRLEKSKILEEIKKLEKVLNSIETYDE